MHTDEIFMQRAMAIAQLGRGSVSPNPMVGCVIVHNGVIIGEGYHRRYGEAHAEVNAVNAVANPELLSESTLYVTLEPCSHFGKTPPCADLIVRHRIPKVVVANVDINPLVSGNGIRKLQEAGIEVQTGVLAREAAEMNRRFFTFMRHKRPYIILKWAESADGLMAAADRRPVWISNRLSRQLVHKWRSEEDAVLTGAGTALHDNPRLNVRDFPIIRRQPYRIVIDRSLQLPPDLHLFDGSQPTICYNLHRSEEQPGLIWQQLPAGTFLTDLFADLYERKIQSVLVEAGPRLLQTLIALDLYDEIRLFRSAHPMGDGIAAPRPQGRMVARENLLGDELLVFRK
ncbi:bifunctional diaminohydroxyphosphoribosylaminopyrimidine deaminase/5-amino-6-(5-phosphoribosylamino)uracil reductase RibD [Rhodoflexus caldus]|uniref:bifunctional diaminohydroxyphosphoribosylaminopyrimidine deaminase/5-amino-6-(5-phosphoribosylamino)uracil reductase RibD n=1 Tax=Rhodoflexus caldus TaxID=2891236 RepID=UPI00202AB7AC|nr:bifunctional diaminohydroxyphosphoribosylaminopyrimidine deaminase/5-amino-6-(5-phosphoribosylamino)uracil reductase RibD [Rhodoflexus caldus]